MWKSVFRKCPEELFLGLIFGLFYFATRVKVYGFVHDAQGFFVALKENVLFDASLFHAHHLLPLPLVWAAIKLGVLFFKEPHSAMVIPAFQAVNSVCMATAMAGVYAILKRRFGYSSRIAFWGTCLTAVTFGCWAYSSALEIYAPAMALLTWMIFGLLAPRFTWRTITSLILLQIIGFFFHSMLVFLGLWALGRLWLLQRQKKAPSFAAVFFALFSMAGGLLGYAYAAWQLHYRSLFLFANWLSPRAGFRYNMVEWESLGRIGLGAGKALFGGFFIFSSLLAEAILEKLAPLHQLSDEAFVTRHFPEWGVIPLCLVGLTVVIGIFWMLKTAWKKGAPNTKEHKTLVRIVGSITLFYFLQGVLAEMTNVDHYLFVLPGLGVLLTVVAVNAFQEKAAFYLKPLAMGLALLVYAGSMAWLADDQNDYFALKSKALIQEAGSDGLIVVETNWQYQMYLYNHPHVLFLGLLKEQASQTWAAEAQAILQKQKSSIVISQTALMLTPYLEKRFGLDQKTVDTIWPNRALILRPHPEFNETIFILEFSDMFFENKLLK